MRKLFLVLGAALCLVIGARIVPASAQQIDRTQLPIPDTQYKYPGKVPLDARDAKFPPIKPLRPPEGAPNVVVILLDDIGFGAPSTFGGGVNMPTLDALAKEGLRYTQFHTTALCSPTREALLTGHNHHSVGMGSITELATSAPGYNSIRPNQAATVAEILKLNGYNTAAFGKFHPHRTFAIIHGRIGGGCVGIGMQRGSRQNARWLCVRGYDIAVNDHASS